MQSPIERALRAGQVERARQLGWLGDLDIYRTLMGTGNHVSIQMTLMKTGAGLGFDLSNNEGVAEVSTVLPDSAAGPAGLKSGDLIRQIDGKTYFTCEAVVEAIRGHPPGKMMSFVIVRREVGGPSMSDPTEALFRQGLAHWCDESLLLNAGAQHIITVDTPAAAVLQFEVIAHNYDIGVKVGEKLGVDDNHEALGRGMLLRMRERECRGHIPLPHAGSFDVVVDNSFSFVRSKRVSYTFALLTESQHEELSRAQRLSQLKNEVGERSRLSVDLGHNIIEQENQLLRLRQQLGSLEAALSTARLEKRENDRLLAKAEAEQTKLQNS